MEINHSGVAALGIGDGVFSLGDGSTPLTREIYRPAASGGWYDEDTVFVGREGRLYLYHVPTDQWVPVKPHGANALCANGGVWAGFLNAEGVGLFSSTDLNISSGALATVGPDGAIAYKEEYQSAGPILVRELDGKEWTLGNRDGVAADPWDIQLLGGRRAVWREGAAHRHDVRVTGPGMTTPEVRAGNLWGPQIVFIADVEWVFYTSEVPGKPDLGVIFHPADDAEKGYVIGPGYSMRALVESSTVVKFMWSAREGELPNDLRVGRVDITSPRRRFDSPVEPPPIEPPPIEPPPRPQPPSITISDYNPREGEVPLTVMALCQILPNSGPIDTLYWSYSKDNGATWISDAQNPPDILDNHFHFDNPGFYLLRLKATGPGGENQTGLRREVKATKGTVIEPPPIEPPPVEPPVEPPRGYTLHRHDYADAFLARDREGWLGMSHTPSAAEYTPGDKGLTFDGFFTAAEPDQRLKADRTVVGEWERFIEERGEREGTVAYKSLFLNKYISMSDPPECLVRCNQSAIGGWESFVKGLVPVKPPPGQQSHPLKGQFRLGGDQQCQPMDDNGPCRPVGYVDFSVLLTLKRDKAGYMRRMDKTAEADYQIQRTLDFVGGNAAWEGSEITCVDFYNNNGTFVAAWPDFDQILREHIREAKARNIYQYVCSGDAYCLHDNPQREIDMHKRIAAIYAEEWPTGVLGAEGNNEYFMGGTNWGNSIYGDHDPEQRDQHQRIMDVWKAAIPGVLFARGSLNNEEPSYLERSCVIGDLCGLHGMRNPWPGAMKRAGGIYYWEGNPGMFAKKYCQYIFSEPGGMDVPGHVGYVYSPWYDVNQMVGIYAMLSCTGGILFNFNGASVNSVLEPDAAPGFYGIPKLLSHIPDDIASWGGAAKSDAGGIWYWRKDNMAVAATAEGWTNTPSWPFAEWTMYGLSPDGNEVTEEKGSGSPRNLNPGEYGRLIVGTF